jgi:hypothetical protein
MGTVTARATAALDAPPDRVLAALRDLEQRPRILTENYTNYRVEPAEGGRVIAYHFAAGGRERDYRLRVEETPDGLRESDELSSFVSVWRVTPAAGSGAASTGAGGDGGSKVTLEASWQGAGGIGGIFEGLFAPMGLRRIYAQVLERLRTAVS